MSIPFSNIVEVAILVSYSMQRKCKVFSTFIVLLTVFGVIRSTSKSINHLGNLYMVGVIMNHYFNTVNNCKLSACLNLSVDFSS